jgi:hypothetical protein
MGSRTLAVTAVAKIIFIILELLEYCQGYKNIAAPDLG